MIYLLLFVCAGGGLKTRSGAEITQQSIFCQTCPVILQLDVSFDN